MFIDVRGPEPPMRHSRCRNRLRFLDDDDLESCQSVRNSTRSVERPFGHRLYLSEFMTSNGEQAHSGQKSASKAAFSGTYSQSYPSSQTKSIRQRLKELELKLKMFNIMQTGKTNNSVDGNNILLSPCKRVDNFDAQAHIDAIMKQTGVLKYNGKEYRMLPDDLQLVSDLGHGICGHVVKMRHLQTGLLMAVKMRRSGNIIENKQIIMDLEVVLKSHDCPFIVQYLGCFVNDVEVWICMELMDICMDKLISTTGCAILEYIIEKVAVSVVKALNYLKEKHGVIHRDAKPSNILMNRNGVVKLCDFNISGRLINSKAFTQTAGCAAYMAPERIQPPDPRNANYNIRADVWSLGISLVEMALGRFPYGVCDNHFEVLTKILLTDSPSLSPKDGFSQEFCNFLSLCLTKDFTKRPKYAQLLMHPFLTYYETIVVDVSGWLESVLSKDESKL